MIYNKFIKRKKLLLVLGAGCVLFLSGCATTSSFTPGSGNKYQYGYSLIYPVHTDNLLFRDDSVIIQFKFDEAAIRFQLQNISRSTIHVVWNKVSLHKNGRYVSVRHADNLYTDHVDTAASVLLPPLGYMRDLVMPRNSIAFDGKEWVEDDLFPTTDNRNPALRTRIMHSAGQQIGLVMPIAFGSTMKNYEFDFQVDSVQQIPWKNYHPSKRFPEPPVSPRHPLLDNVTTAIIVVGVLGFSAYLITAKKNPPVE
ncbi:MAG TPA: hypothetical protein VMU30_01605 [Bacteroidota bacterium]|nr:hypothetical protein [Bacteroidota bacterium]